MLGMRLGMTHGNDVCNCPAVSVWVALLPHRNRSIYASYCACIVLVLQPVVSWGGFSHRLLVGCWLGWYFSSFTFRTTPLLYFLWACLCMIVGCLQPLLLPDEFKTRDEFTRAMMCSCSRIVGVLALNHVIRLVGWLKRVTFRSEACLSRSEVRCSGP